MNKSYAASTKGTFYWLYFKGTKFFCRKKKNSSNNRTKSDIFKLTSNCLCDAHYYFVFFLENEYFESAFSGRSHFAFYVSTVLYH